MNMKSQVGIYKLPEELKLPKDKDLNAMPFGRQLEHIKVIKKWKETAMSVLISQKKQSFAKAMKEFKDLYLPTYWFTSAVSKKDSPNYYHDSFEVFYTRNEEDEKKFQGSFVKEESKETTLPV